MTEASHGSPVTASLSGTTQLLDQLTDIVLVFDARGHVLHANPTACERLGYDLQALCCLNLETIFAAGDGRALEATSAAVEADSSELCTAPLRSRDGTLVAVETRFSSVTWDGAPALLGLARDLTDRALVEAARWQSEAEKRALLTAIPDGIFRLSADGMFLDHVIANRFSTLVPPDQFIGKPVYEVMPEPIAQALVSAIRRTIGSETVQYFEYQLPYGPELRDYEARLVDIGDGDVLGVVRDITDFRALERRLQHSAALYRRLASNLPRMAVLLFDRDLNFTLAEGAILTNVLFGAAEVEGMPISAVFAPETATRILPNFQAALRGYESHLEETINGRLYAIHVLPIADDEASSSGMLVIRDITDDRRAELALRTSESRFRALAENISFGVAIFQKGGQGQIQITYTNPPHDRLVGYTLEEVRDHPLMLIHRDDRKLVIEHLNAKFEGTGGDQHIEFRIRRKDGELRWFDLGAALFELDGKPALIAALSDITERKAAEDALRRRDAILKSVSVAAEKFFKGALWHQRIDSVLELLGTSTAMSRVYIFEYHVDPHGTPVISQRYEWVADGISPQIDNPDLQNMPLQGGPVDRWIQRLRAGQPVYGDDLAMGPNERALMQSQNIRSIALMPIFVGDQWWGLIGFDMCWEHYHWSDAELDALETAANLLGAAIQRQQVETALRESETKFSQLVNNIPEVFWLRDRADGRFLYLSPAFERVWGSSIEKAYENPAVLLEVAHPEDRERVNALLAADQDQPASFEYRVLVGNEVRWVWTRSFPIVDEDGVVRQIAGIARDITERKRAELQSFELAVEQERVRILSNFILEVSHEFRTPLSVINTSVYLLNRISDPDRQSEHLGKISEQVRSINALVDGMLTITRLDGAGSTQQQPIAINEMLIGLREKLEDRLEAKQINLREDYASDLPMISGDRDELALMLRHVLDNAVRYTEQGGRVSIASRAVDGEVVIEVADTGVGIKPSALPSIFDVFFREDSAHTTKGLGLGLSIVKRVAERHRGSVEVESEVGRGSIFRIRLPRAGSASNSY